LIPYFIVSRLLDCVFQVFVNEIMKE
jgi:hypothetical protein